jgi:glutamyl endopeptidase
MEHRRAEKSASHSLANATVILAMVSLALSQAAAMENILPTTAEPRRALTPLDRIVAMASDGKVIDFNREAYGLPGEFMASSRTQIVLSKEPQPQSGTSSLKTTGNDNRVQIQDTTVFPFSAVARIEGQFTPKNVFICTGWMLGPSTVVTAGHCIYDFADTKQFAYNITVTPAYNAAASSPAPFGRCKALRGIVLSPWLDTGGMAYDYGVYQLDCRIGEQTGNLGFKIVRGCGVGTSVTVTGYPMDKGSTTMWSGLGSTNSCDANSIYYNANTAGGQSGGPVWDAADPVCQTCVVATHANEITPDMKQGPRINETAFSFLTSTQSFMAPLPIDPPVLTR